MEPVPATQEKPDRSRKIVFLLAFLSACSTTQYLPYETRQNQFEGTGGTKETVQTIDIWRDGSPPRPFKILGVITDERNGGLIPQSTKLGDIAKATKAAGGDAVILGPTAVQFVGTVSAANLQSNYATGVTTAVQKFKEKYVVIKYLD